LCELKDRIDTKRDAKIWVSYRSKQASNTSYQGNNRDENGDAKDGKTEDGD